MLLRIVPVVLACSAVHAQERISALPDTGGVFYQTPAGWRVVPGALLYPEIRDEWRWTLAVGDEHYSVDLPGAHASVQFHESRPTLYVHNMYPAAAATLVRVESRKNSRRLHAGNVGRWPPALRFREADTIPVEITGMDHVYAVRPVRDLQPGEYVLLASGVPGQRMILFGAPFTIAQ